MHSRVCSPLVGALLLLRLLLSLALRPLPCTRADAHTYRRRRPTRAAPLSNGRNGLYGAEVYCIFLASEAADKFVRAEQRVLLYNAAAHVLSDQSGAWTIGRLCAKCI